MFQTNALLDIPHETVLSLEYNGFCKYNGEILYLGEKLSEYV